MNQVNWLLPLLAIASGCGWYPFPYRSGPYSVKAGCIEARSDFVIDQDLFRRDVDLARSILDSQRIVKAADFCDEFKHVPIAISFNPRVAKGDGEHTGYYSRLRGILLARGGDALAHELIHEVDVTKNYNFCSGSHCGWSNRGYWRADNEYIISSTNLSDGSPNWNH